MIGFTKGRYTVRVTRDARDLKEAQELRARCFGLKEGVDADGFDVKSAHVLVRTTEGGKLVCCFRMLPLRGRSICQSYSAQYYDLTGLRGLAGNIVEVGRFCVAPNLTDPDILRVAWGAMARYVDSCNVSFLFGCSSFAGTKPEAYLDAFAMLAARHLAPESWLPQEKVPNVFRFETLCRRARNSKKAMQQLPPLLRTYLTVGARVSDHAVIDHKMNTLHVFTGLEIDAIPDARKRSLRAVAD